MVLVNIAKHGLDLSWVDVGVGVHPGRHQLGTPPSTQHETLENDVREVPECNGFVYLVGVSGRRLIVSNEKLIVHSSAVSSSQQKAQQLEARNVGFTRCTSWPALWHWRDCEAHNLSPKYGYFLGLMFRPGRR